MDDFSDYPDMLHVAGWLSQEQDASLGTQGIASDVGDLGFFDEFFDDQGGLAATEKDDLEKLKATHEREKQELKDTYEKAIKDLELKHQQALAENQKKLHNAQLVASHALSDLPELRTQKEKVEEQMKTMQVRMQEMAATIKSLNEQLATPAVSKAAALSGPSDFDNFSNQTFASAAVPDTAIPSGSMDFDDFFNDPANWIADTPASTQPSSSSSSSSTSTGPSPSSSKSTDSFNFGNISNDFNFTYKPSQPFTPTSQQLTSQNSAQNYYLHNRNSLPQPATPVTPTPAPAKKRKTSSSSPFVGDFYQCRQLYDVKIPGPDGKSVKSGVTLFCGVINNQAMAGGKSNGEPRQRCVNKVCRKYTDIKHKHWVDGWVVDMFGVGVQAPMDTPKMAGL